MYCSSHVVTELWATVARPGGVSIVPPPFIIIYFIFIYLPCCIVCPCWPLGMYWVMLPFYYFCFTCLCLYLVMICHHCTLLLFCTCCASPCGQWGWHTFCFGCCHFVALWLDELSALYIIIYTWGVIIIFIILFIILLEVVGVGHSYMHACSTLPLHFTSVALYFLFVGSLLTCPIR